MVRDTQEAEQTAELPREPQQVFQTAIVQAEMLLHEKSGEQAGGAIDRASVLLRSTGSARRATAWASRAKHSR